MLMLYVCVPCSSQDSCVQSKNQLYIIFYIWRVNWIPKIVSFVVKSVLYLLEYIIWKRIAVSCVIPWLRFSLTCSPEDFISTSLAAVASLLIVYILDMVAVHFNLILFPFLKCFISQTKNNNWEQSRTQSTKSE